MCTINRLTDSGLWSTIRTLVRKIKQAEAGRPEHLEMQMRKTVIFGTPLTPARHIDELAGESFCLSYGSAARINSNLHLYLSNVAADGMVLVDNGAWSAYQKGVDMGAGYWAEYEKWAKQILDDCPQAVAVVPDSITGDAAENVRLAEASTLPRDRAMVVWHMHEPLELLKRWASEYRYVAIGSSGEYAKVGTKKWHGRIAEAFKALGAERPHIHMMRAQSMHHLYDFDSSDSSNVAVNHCRYKHEGAGHVARFAARIKAKIEASADGAKRIDTPAEVAMGAAQFELPLA